MHLNAAIRPVQQTVLEQTALEQTVLEQTALEQTVLEQTVLEQTVLEQTVLEQTVLLEQTALEQTESHRDRSGGAVLRQPIRLQLFARCRGALRGRRSSSKHPRWFLSR